MDDARDFSTEVAPWAFKPRWSLRLSRASNTSTCPSVATKPMATRALSIDSGLEIDCWRSMMSDGNSG